MFAATKFEGQTGVSLSRGGQAKAASTAGGRCGAAEPKKQDHKTPPWEPRGTSVSEFERGTDRGPPGPQYEVDRNVEAVDSAGKAARDNSRITDRIGAASRP